MSLITPGQPATGVVTEIPRNKMSLREMRDKVYFLADEESNDIFRVAGVNSAINAGIAEVSNYEQPDDTIAFLTAMQGDSAFDLIDPVLVAGEAQISAVELDGVALPRLPSGMRAPETGDPRYYDVKRDAVILVPAATRICELAVAYLKEPSKLVNDTDICEASREGAELACLYAVYLLKMKDDEWNAADRWKAAFDKGIRSIGGPRVGVYKGV